MTPRGRAVAVGTTGPVLIGGAAAATALAGAAVAVAGTVCAVLVFVVFRIRADVITAVSGVVVVTLLVPAQLRIAPLGAAGTPAALAGAAAFGMWAYGFALGRPWLARGRQPARWAVAAVVASVLASYVVLGLRSPDGLELRAGDRGVFTVMSLAGVLLLAADAIPDRAALRRVLSAVVGAGAAMAGLGIVQFVSGVDVASRVAIPGFSYVSAEYDPERSGFTRIVSTTSHPIELSVVLVLLLPLAFHLAFTADPDERRRWWLCTCLIGATVPMTVSRTAVVALAVAGLVLFPAWSSRQRRLAAKAALLGLVAVKLAAPGLIGTLRAILLNPGRDPSLRTRDAARTYAESYVLDRPLFGRGFGTFLPTRYHVLDNQYLLSLVETGVVGLVALLLVPLVAAWQVGIVRRRSPHAEDRDLAQAFLACMLVGYASWLTFDGLSFSTSRTLLLFAVGCAAALWRIAGTPDEEGRTAGIGRPVPVPVRVPT